MSKGQELYIKAKKIIPGGTMLFSKRPELILPNFWPTYYSKAKGCYIWGLDNKKYIDMSLMGVGTNSLGYANKNIDNIVKTNISKSNLSTLNCPEEVYLAEKLIEINPWAEMVRFARTGGEANSIAIRIGRAASGKDKVAVCGYHGWHDWYLSANIENPNGLEGHVLPGMKLDGVPNNLKNTVFPFKYNDFDQLLSITDNNDIGVIKMEVIRNNKPENDFLNKVRALAKRKNIVLIFDECTSGFRETFGGIHKKYKINPDIVIFGKTLGNGYAISAIVGRKEVMESAQNTFISSTFWTERIGSTAALATLEEMWKLQSWKKITKTGNIVREGWKKLSGENDLKIQIAGIPALSSYVFESKKNLSYKTFIAQEMLKKGFLASTYFYACTSHKKKHIDKYFECLDPIYKIISKSEKDQIDINDFLDGPVCQESFKRLN